MYNYKCNDYIYLFKGERKLIKVYKIGDRSFEIDFLMWICSECFWYFLYVYFLEMSRFFLNEEMSFFVMVML